MRRLASAAPRIAHQRGKSIEVERDSLSEKGHVFGSSETWLGVGDRYVSILNSCGFCRLIRWITVEIVGIFTC
jgi:hypothetical protein